MAYTDTTTLKRYLGITGTGDDTLLAELIVTAQKIIDGKTDRTFEATADSTRYFTVGVDTRGSYLYLDGDLASVTSVTNGDGTTVTAAQYTTEPKNGTPIHVIKLLRSSGVIWLYDNNGDPEDAIAVTGRWAYCTTASSCTLADVPGICKRIAAYLYRQKDNAGDLDRAIIAGNATILPAKLPPDIDAMLAPLRRLAG